MTRLSVTLVTSAFLALGCSANPEAPTDTIEYGHQQEPPCLTGGWVQEAYLERQFLDSLTSQTHDGQIVPWLALSWSVSPDQRTWTFRLKPGVRFTDGTPLDAAAVKANFEYNLSPTTANSTVTAYLGEYYQSSEAPDPTTFVLHLTKPYSPLLSVLSQGYFGIQSPTALARGLQANCEQPIGSGPFIVQKWERGKDIIFVRNPNYSSAPANARHQGPPYVSRLVWKFLADPVTRYGSLTSGQSDVIYNPSSVNWADANARYQVLRYVTPGRPVTLSLNATHVPFDDVLVRRAFAYCADRRTSVDTAFLGEVTFNGNGALSQSTPNYDPGLETAYPYNPAAANSLLDQAGWTGRDSGGYRTKGGRRLSVRIVYPAGAIVDQEGATVLQDIQAQAREVGFDVRLIPATQSEYFGGSYSGRSSYEATTGYWTSPSAAVLYINWRQNLPGRPNGSNNAYYNNPELERTIEAANSTLAPDEQRALYFRAQQIISDQATAVGLYTQTTTLVVGPRLRDVWIEDSQGEPVFSDAYFAK